MTDDPQRREYENAVAEYQARGVCLASGLPFPECRSFLCDCLGMMWPKGDWIRAKRIKDWTVSLSRFTDRRVPHSWGPLLSHGSDGGGEHWSLTWHSGLRQFALTVERDAPPLTLPTVETLLMERP